MVRFSFAKDPETAVKGSGSVMVVAPAAYYRRRGAFSFLAPAHRKLISALAQDTLPGLYGNAASTLTGVDAPKRLVIGVLPDRVSRYNAASRPSAIQRVMQSANLSRAKRSALIVVLDKPEHQTSVLNAIGRAFPIFSAKSEEQPQGRLQICMITKSGEPVPIASNAKDVASTSREVAALVDSPPTDMHPEALAAQAKLLLKGVKRVRFKELAGEQLLKNGLNGIHAVGRSAVVAPRLFMASYTPAKASDQHIALVGKGVTFDTGGLHLKPRGAMEGMKVDMGGAAAVLGAFRVLSQNDCRHRLTLLLCLAENAIGPEALKPDDIIEMHSGRTVEINNTDAEGRLLLADGVSYASRNLKADIIFDAATLTGAQLIATGSAHGAVMANDAALEQLTVKAGFDSGDLVHPLPFAPEFYKPEFKSPVADMRNSVKNRANAQTSCAGQFIHNHLEGTGARWCHVDLAGPAFRGDRGTGFGVALLSQAISQL
ncbi:MAG: leucyl aminopeptidase family protein [Myxococcota bacterium]